VDQIFTSQTVSVKGVAGPSVCQAVKLRGAEFSGVKEQLDGVHCGTQRTQEFTVGLIKPMKSRALKQQAKSSVGKHWEEEREEPVNSSVNNNEQRDRTSRYVMSDISSSFNLVNCRFAYK